MTINQLVKSLDIRNIDFTVSTIDCTKYDKLLEKLMNKYDQNNINLHLKNNLFKLIDATVQGFFTWDELVENNILLSAIKATIEDLKFSNQAITEENLEVAIKLENLSIEDIDNKCPFMPLNLELDNWLEEAKLNNKKYLLCVADTGAGKTLKLIKWLSKTYDELQSGIILTHCNRAADEIYNHIKYLNKEKENSVLLFNADPKNSDIYERIKQDPTLFSKYNWIICFNMRLMQTDTNVMFSMMNAFHTRNRLRGENARTYLISDEGILSSGVDQLKRADIDKINVVSNNALSNYVSNPTQENRLQLELYFTKLCKRIDSLKSPLDISPEDNSILSSFTNVEVKNSTMYQLKVYLARLSAFFDYMFNEYNEFSTKYKDIVNYKDFIKYDIPMVDVAGTHNLIIFDATGEINYGYDNKYFYIKKLAKLPRNIINWHILDIELPNRHCTREEFDATFDNFRNKGFKFKDDSLVIWWSNPYCENDYEQEAKIRLEKYISETGSKRCLVSYFNGAEIRGDNRFSNCTNVYILGNYDWNSKAIGKARKATMNENFRNDTKFCSDTIQAIGRTRIRKSFGIKLLDDNPGVIDVYISKDVDSRNIASLLNYYGFKPFRLDMSNDVAFNKWLDIAISNAYAYDYKVCTNEFSNIYSSKNGELTINCVKFLAKLVSEGIHEVSIKSLAQELGINVPELRKFKLALKILEYIGLNMRIISKKSSIQNY